MSLLSATALCASFTLSEKPVPTQPYELVVNHKTCSIELVELDKLCFGDFTTDINPPIEPVGPGNGSGGAGGEADTVSNN